MKIPKNEKVALSTLTKLKKEFRVVKKSQKHYINAAREHSVDDFLESNRKKWNKGYYYIFDSFENEKEIISKMKNAVKEERKKEKEKRKKEKEYWRKNIDIKGNLTMQNTAKKLNIYVDIQQEYNGYGYVITARIISMKDYKKILKYREKNCKEIIVLSDEEKTEKWAKRLSKLTGISIEIAEEIAEEKLEYYQELIDRWEPRYNRIGVILNQKYLTKLERENPLRRIEGEEHAERILSASRRHNDSDYEIQLEIAKEKRDLGKIDKEDVQTYARQNMSFLKNN